MLCQCNWRYRSKICANAAEVTEPTSHSSAKACRERTAELGLSDQPAVIGPVQQRLALAGAAVEVATLAGPLELADVAAHGFPAPDLARVIGHAAPAIVAAVPLEPAARIVRVNPALGAPDRERLARLDAEKVERRIAPAMREPRSPEPARRKLVP